MTYEQKNQLEFILQCFERNGIPIKLTGTNNFQPLYDSIGIISGQFSNETVILDLSQDSARDRDHRLEKIYHLLDQKGIALKIPYYNGNPESGPISFVRYLELTKR